MHDTVDALVIDLLEWVGSDGRPYREVIEVWRTSCPRLPVWETAHERGLLEQRRRPDAETEVILSARGRELVRQRRAARRSSESRAVSSTG